MRRIAIATAAVGLVLAGASAASAQTPCDSYSGECPPSGTTSVLPTTIVRPDVEGTNAVQPEVEGTKDVRGGGVQLPMTGGELATLLLVGAAAVGGGATLVLAGRRGKHSA
jgi:LPXTG-motif cell wall-anchored protein